MNTNKLIIGGLLGALVYLVIGMATWIAFYGNMLTVHVKSGLMKTDADTNFLPLLLSHLAFGLLLSYVITGKSGMNPSKGFVTGAIVGLLTNSTYDLVFYASSNMFKGYKIVLLDIALYTLLSAITGAAVGWYAGRSKA